MARGLLAEGRAADVARMLEPLLAGGDGAGQEAGAAMLHALLARVRLLRHGEARRALALLAPCEALLGEDTLDPNVRGEVALWLGWVHAWEDAETHDGARALHLFDRAARLFRQGLNTGGRCWTLLGRAHVYDALGEVRLMQQALEEATPLEEAAEDVQAALWLQDLHVRLDRYEGRYACARMHLDRMTALAREQDDLLAQGRATAYGALLAADQGRPPETFVGEARAATELLTRHAVNAGWPLLEAFGCQIRALLLQGAFDEADPLIDRALRHCSGLPEAGVDLLCYRVHIALVRGEEARASSLLNRLLPALPQRRRTAGTVALLRSRLFRRQGQAERALAWGQRAYQHARETGHNGHRLQVLFYLARLAADQGDFTAARAHLQETEAFSGYFSALPFAARRFHALGHLARTEGHTDDARAALTQALSAYALMGDVYHTACLQRALAELGRTRAPAQTRPLLDAALLTFDRLRAHPDLEAARALRDRWPHEGAGTPETFETTLGATLAQAAVSVELVAEAWLQAAERLLPGRWMGVYCCPEGGAWRCVHAHGPAPATLVYPAPQEARARQEDVVWVRLRPHPGPAFFFCVAAPESDPAWEVAEARLHPWLPVAALALDHALLRARRLTAALPDDLAHNGTPEIPLPGFVYAGPAMRQVARQIHRIRASHSPVLITGESGTGKELIARAIHTTSERHPGPFLAFNCSTVPRELFESHLFGHEKGAFTGAVRAHPGVIREADGGTLFLDEIGDLPLDVQPKLLRFLEEGEVFPLGAQRPVQVNVRILAATNRDLEALIREGRFREDLYYRLNVIPVHVPPLRERREDLPLLVRHFLQALRPAGAPVATLTQRALDALLRYDWPGNVRQLRNELERALVYVTPEPAPTIDLEDLSPTLQQAHRTARPLSFPPPPDQILQPGYRLDDLLADTERRLIEQVLHATGGQVSAAAEMLGLTRQGLYKKMKRLGIDAAAFQPRAAGEALPVS